MAITGVVTQLRTTDLRRSVHFYVAKVGLTLAFEYGGFYAGVRAGDQLFHLKLADEKDPSIDFVEHGEHFHLYLETDDIDAVAERLKSNGVPLVGDVHKTEWQTRELVIRDDQGHTVYFGERLPND